MKEIFEKQISIPCSIWVTVDPDFDETDEDALFQAVLDQHGKYPEIDSRNLGYGEITVHEG